MNTQTFLAAALNFDAPTPNLDPFFIWAAVAILPVVFVVVLIVARRNTHSWAESLMAAAGLALSAWMLVFLLATFVFLSVQKGLSNEHNSAVAEHLSADYGVTVTDDNAAKLLDGDTLLLADRTTGNPIAVTLIETTAGGIAVVNENSDIIEPLTK